MNPYLTVFLCTLAGIIILSLFSKSADSRYNKTFVRQIQISVRKALKAHNTSKQDTNLLVSLIDNCKALAQANLARSLTTEEHIQKITKVNINELIYYLEKDQADILNRIYSACPSLKITGVYDIHAP